VQGGWRCQCGTAGRESALQKRVEAGATDSV
jgi:hypothetical protein